MILLIYFKTSILGIGKTSVPQYESFSIDNIKFHEIIHVTNGTLLFRERKRVRRVRE